MSLMPEAFEVLWVTPDATEEEVRRAYRTLAHIFHPDRFGDAPEGVILEATRRMQAVTQAYNEMQGGRLVYWELPGWTYQQRGTLTVRLLRAHIPHRWDEDGELSVDRRHEDAVDSIFENLRF
jgi:hypothetical protein